MGSSDGTVLGVTKLLNNGPDADLCNIVLVAEGFTAGEQGDFNNLCDDFVAALQAETWYSVLSGGLNVHRLNVESDESGADDPDTCPEGDGTTVDTYFDASYCNGGIHRCMHGDFDLVRDELDAALPEWHAGAVLVNTTAHGGCANGNVFFSSVKPGWEDIALHELGHAAFGLADEYNYWAGCDSGENTQDVFSGTASQPNVTTVTNPDTIKWRHLFSPGVPIPTMLNPDCSECDERANVLDDDTKIGLFEGAKYAHCGVFRPAYICRMRSNTADFCRVCAEAIAIDLGGFADGNPVLEVTPLALNFGEIAYGLTLYLGFEVRNVRSGHPMPMDVTLTAPTGVFEYVPDTELTFTLPAPIFESYTSKNVYVAFTSNAADVPTVIGEAVVTAGAQSATVNLEGSPVVPIPVDSVLVIDRSDSMDGATGVLSLEKVDMAIEAADLFVDLLKENDEIGIVRYNDQSDASDVLLAMQVAGAIDTGPGRVAAKAELTKTNLDPQGFTSIGGGIINGSSVLDGASADARALVVLTDGIQNTDPAIPEARSVVETKSPDQRVFAVGLGLNQLEDTLDEIATATNGVAQITGDLVDEREFLLQKLYVQILSDISDEAFVKDPVQYLRPGQCVATPVYLSEVDVSCDFIVTWRPSPVYPKYLKVWLEAPDGTIIDAGTTGPNVDYLVRQRHLFYRVLFPLRPDDPHAHAGMWRVWVQTLDLATTAAYGGEGLTYSVMAKARTNLMLAGYVEQIDHFPGALMDLVLQPTLFGFPVGLDDPVRAVVTRPDGALRTVDLDPDGLGSYRGVYTDTPLVGHYGIDCDVSATSPQGHRITRYRHMTGTIFVPGTGGGGGHGGGNGGGGGQGGDPCDPELERLCEEAWRALRILAELLRRCCGSPGRPKAQISVIETALDDLVAQLASFEDQP